MEDSTDQIAEFVAAKLKPETQMKPEGNFTKQHLKLISVVVVELMVTVVLLPAFLCFSHLREERLLQQEPFQASGHLNATQSSRGPTHQHPLWSRHT